MRPIITRTLAFLLALLVCIALTTPDATAQLRRPSPLGPTGSSPSGPYFDPSHLITLRGELVGSGGDWESRGHGNFTGGGIHYELKADDGELYDLMLAPEWFLADLGITLRAGDRVTVTGSPIEPYSQQPWMNGPRGHGGHPAHGPHEPGNGPPSGGDPGSPGSGEPPGGSPDFLVVTRLEVAYTTVDLRDDEGYPLWRGGPMDSLGPWFDPDFMVHLRGVLVESLGFWSPWGFGNHTGAGMHYLFASEGGETFVTMLGPWWYLDLHGRVPDVGEPIEVSGSVVDPYWSGLDEHRYLIATEILVGTTAIPLRDEEGYPLWRGDWGHYYAPEYDPASEVVVSGTVIRTRSSSYDGHRDPGYEVSLLMERGDLGDNGVGRCVLFVAPRWYVEEQGFGLRSEERIEVRGSLGRDFLGRPSLVARTVSLGGRSWTFRDEHGSPLWMEGAVP